MSIKIGHLEVYENINKDILIQDKTDDWGAIAFDECMAEKLCKAIMKVAKEIREQENGMD